jgi:hypothetical protein
MMMMMMIRTARATNPKHPHAQPQSAIRQALTLCHRAPCIRLLGLSGALCQWLHLDACDAARLVGCKKASQVAHLT